MSKQLRNRKDRNDREAIRKRRLRRILHRDIKRMDAGFDRRDRHRKNARDRAELALKAELAEEGALLIRQADHALRSQDAKQDRQIVQCAGFLGICWRKVHRDAAGWKPETGGLDGGTDTLSCLFDRNIRQADDFKCRKSV